jgi:hypothetical protein
MQRSYHASLSVLTQLSFATESDAMSAFDDLQMACIGSEVPSDKGWPDKPIVAGQGPSVSGRQHIMAPR